MHNKFDLADIQAFETNRGARAQTISAAAAGRVSSVPISKALDCSRWASTASPVWMWRASIGRIAVPSAMPTMPSGSWFSRSASLSKVSDPCGALGSNIGSRETLTGAQGRSHPGAQCLGRRQIGQIAHGLPFALGFLHLVLTQVAAAGGVSQTDALLRHGLADRQQAHAGRITTGAGTSAGDALETSRRCAESDVWRGSTGKSAAPATSNRGPCVPE